MTPILQVLHDFILAQWETTVNFARSSVLLCYTIPKRVGIFLVCNSWTSAVLSAGIGASAKSQKKLNEAYSQLNKLIAC